jgi:hypothetical protein
MTTNASGRNVQDELNRCMPAAKHAKLGDVLVDLIVNTNADVVDGTALIAAISTSVMNSGALAILAGASPSARTTVPILYMVSGVLLRKAASTMAPLVGTLATAKSAAWAFYIDAAGVLTTSAKTADANTHDLALAALPAVPAGKAQIGVLVLDNATGAGFIGGTTALDTASLTSTYYNTTGPVVLATGLVQSAVAVATLDARNG